MAQVTKAKGLGAPVPYAVLLRGVNVGGKAKVPMAELRRALEEAGVPGARTYLQSGNVVVLSPEPADVVGGLVTEVLIGRFGVTGKVVVLDRDQLAAVVEQNPMPDLAAINGSRFFVDFSTEEIDRSARERIAAADFGGDRAEVVGTVVYLWCEHGISASPIGRFPWDRVLPGTTTMRNWNTVTKVLQLLDGS